jgi:integrase/recombinase XerD
LLVVADWQSRMQPTSVTCLATGLRAVLREIAPHIAHAVPMIRRPPPRPVRFTDEEFTAMYLAAPPPLKLFLLLCRTLGLRFSEAFRVCPVDYDREHHHIIVRVKGGRSRTLPVTKEIEALFDLAPADADPETPYYTLLRGPSHRGTYTHTARHLRREWLATIKRAGIRSTLIPHDLRRSAATQLFADTQNLRAVQQLLGHRSLATTALYLTPFAPEEMQPLVEALNPMHFIKRRK